MHLTSCYKINYCLYLGMSILRLNLGFTCNSYQQYEEQNNSKLIGILYNVPFIDKYISK